MDLTRALKWRLAAATIRLGAVATTRRRTAFLGGPALRRPQLLRLGHPCLLAAGLLACRLVRAARTYWHAPSARLAWTMAATAAVAPAVALDRAAVVSGAAGLLTQRPVAQRTQALRGVTAGSWRRPELVAHDHPRALVRRAVVVPARAAETWARAHAGARSAAAAVGRHPMAVRRAARCAASAHARRVQRAPVAGPPAARPCLPISTSSALACGLMRAASGWPSRGRHCSRSGTMRLVADRWPLCLPSRSTFPRASYPRAPCHTS